MRKLSAAYEQLARPWTHELLDDHFRAAQRHAELLPECEQSDLVAGPIALLAAAVPASATVSVAVHVIHVLPDTGNPRPLDELVVMAQKSGAVALHRCHAALNLDGGAHNYAADEWLPVVYDVAGRLLEHAHHQGDPPSAIEHAQAAVRRLSEAIISLDQGMSDAAEAIADTMGMMLAVYVLTDVVLDRASGLDDERA